MRATWLKTLGLIIPLLWLSPSAGSARPDLAAAEALITAQDLLGQVKVLASSEMEGRATGTVGLERAAAYIAGEFKRAGLKPGGDQGTYFQTFEVTTGIKLGARNVLALQGKGSRAKPLVFEGGQDFTPFGFSEEGLVRGEVIFAGYGITAPEFHYDDYAAIDARGKIVLVMTHEPEEKNPKGPFRDPNAFRYTEIRYKVLNAREHGAKGIIIVTDPNHAEEELFAIRGVSSGAQAGIVAVNALRKVAEAILSASGKDLRALQQAIDHTFQPHSFPIEGVTVTLEVSLVKEKGRAANVIGILPGVDPELRRTAIVIGAHYDALGRGGEASLAPSRYGELHPGADDNASGTAGVITLAKALAAAGGLKRSVVFVAFAGEEMGLLGSSYYVKHPPIPIEQTVAMLNLDSVGRMREKKLYIHGVETGKEFRELIQRAGDGLDLQLTLGGDGLGPSDHTAFYTKDRPVLFFFTGPHEDYHRPSDTPEKINAEGLQKIVTLVLRIVTELANRPEPVAFVKAEGGPPPASGRGSGGYGPYFGSIPDFAEAGVEGVRLSGVRVGSPAEKAGLRAGDVIVRFGGVTIRNLYDLTYALRSKRAGDKVEVVFLRDGKEMTATTVLEQRR